MIFKQINIQHQSINTTFILYTKVYMFTKKDKLNWELYERHLKAAKEWGAMCHNIQNFVNEKLNHNMEKKYKILDLKINILTCDQNQQRDNKIQFYPTVVNNTNIDFSNEEIALLNKALTCIPLYTK